MEMDFSAGSRPLVHRAYEVGGRAWVWGRWWTGACEFLGLVVGYRGISEREVKVFWFDGMSA
jgi:hypothetical protein